MMVIMCTSVERMRAEIAAVALGIPGEAGA